MTDVVAGFVGAAIAALTGATVVGILSWVKRRVKLSGPQAEQVRCNTLRLLHLQPLVMMLLAAQKPQLLALMTILEALKEKMNGGFERAHGSIKLALDTFDKSLMEALASDQDPEKEFIVK